MKRIYSKVMLILILLIIWVVLNESISLETMISGFAFALISIILTQFLFNDNHDIASYYMPLWFFILYVFAMIYFIIKASILLVINLIKGKKRPRVVTIKSKLKNPWYTSIVANSITLTPGTVTLDKKGDTMEVLYYFSSSEDPKDNYKEVAWQFERLFLIIDGGF